jgi:hypothetical protein
LTLYVTKCGDFGAERSEKGQNRAGDSHGSVNLHLCRIQVVWDDPEALDGASGPPDAPFLPAYTLDTGIRLDSNTCPGGPGEVPYGEVNAYPGNTCFVSGMVGTRSAESGVAAHDSGRILLGGGDAGS